MSPNEGFLGLKGSDVSHTSEQATAYIIPYGLEASVSYGAGTAHGPEAVIQASHQVELFDEQWWHEIYREYGIATLEYPDIPQDLNQAISHLKKITRDVVSAKKFPLFLGGEHTITAGIIAELSMHHEAITILHFDAHADLRDGYDGVHYSHAAALRRCLDNTNVSLVSFGIRNISQEEVPFLEANLDRIKIYWAKDKSTWDYKAFEAYIRNKTVYLSFDVDGFDSSLMPATGTPEPGGLFWDDVMQIIDKASSISHFIGADICELAPKDGLHACDFLVAKLAYKILSFSLAAKKKKRFLNCE
mgnify:CR=1 FL=1